MQNIDALVFLSNDHRAVEALFTKLEAGHGEREEIIGQLVQELSAHAQIEEAILYPAVRRNVEGGRRLADQAEAEHQQVTEMLQELESVDPNSSEADALIQELHQSMQAHVEEEQGPGGLFSMLKESMDHEELRGMGAQLAQAKIDATVEPLDEEEKAPWRRDVGGSMFSSRVDAGGK